MSTKKSWTRYGVWLAFAAMILFLVYTLGGATS